MMGICGASTANETRLLGDRFDMLAIANAPRRCQPQHAFINNLGSSFPASLGRFGFVPSSPHRWEFESTPALRESAVFMRLELGTA